MVAWETYSNSLVSKGHGRPLWQPDPGPFTPVQLADVGYLSDGAFIKLFNASKDIDDRSNRLGLPNGHIPLPVGDIQLSTPLPMKPDYIASGGVSEMGVDLSVTAGAFGQGGSGFSFECSAKQGGLLIMGDVAYRQDAIDRGRYLDYIVKHSRSWLTFAEGLGRGHISLSDLILVTGCDKTSEWACAAWSEKTKSLRLSFVAGAPGIVEGSAGLWGRWVSSQTLDKNVGPRHLTPATAVADATVQLPSSAAISTDEPPSQVIPPLSSAGPSPPSNQCVFIRGFQMGDRTTFFKRKKIRVDEGSGFMTVRKPLDRKNTEKKDPAQSADSLEQSSSRSGQSGASRRDLQLTDSERWRQSKDEGYYDSDNESCTDTEITPTEAMIGYIFENSTAKLAVVHDEDLNDLLRECSDLNIWDYGVWIRELAPSVYLDDSGMQRMLGGQIDRRMQLNENLYAEDSPGVKEDDSAPSKSLLGYIYAAIETSLNAIYTSFPMAAASDSDVSAPALAQTPGLDWAPAHSGPPKSKHPERRAGPGLVHSRLEAQPSPSLTSDLCILCHARPKFVEGRKRHDFCSKRCARKAQGSQVGGQLQSKTPTAMPSNLCMLCHTRPKYVADMKTYDFCGLRCARKAIGQVCSTAPGMCEFCHKRPKYADGWIHNYCSKTCASASQTSGRSNIARTH